jgi:hypothetical protein
MTPQLEAAIAAIQPLSNIERQQLLQILIQSHPNLETLNEQFWQGMTIEELLGTQTPTTMSDLKDLAADFWPEEDSIEDFLAFLQQQRRALI